MEDVTDVDYTHAKKRKKSWNFEIKNLGEVQEAQIASNNVRKILSNKNGIYWFINIFLISGGDNIYVLIALLQIFILNYPVS